MVIRPDPWLERWLPLIRERAGENPVFEIGCGHGDDTVFLVRSGLQVVAFDLSRAAVAIARVRAPAATIRRGDVREPFPSAVQGVGVVLASLSLHYFSWKDTLAIVNRVRLLLRPGGVLLCRLNSTEDHHFGARGHAEIEPNYFLVDNQPKRFFDREMVCTLFKDGWKQLSLDHFVTRKYVKPKALWELTVERCET